MFITFKENEEKENHTHKRLVYNNDISVWNRKQTKVTKIIPQI